MDDNPKAPRITSKNNNDLLVELSVHMKRLLKIIEGNGKSGLIDRVTCLENDTREAMKSIEKIDKHVREHDISSRHYIDVIEDLQRSIDRHFAEDAKRQKILEVKQDERSSWWNRVGLEIVKMFISAAGAVLVAYLLFNLKLGG